MTGHPATMAGTDFAGERPAVETPWRVPVTWASVTLGCRWPSPASALRGAVASALGPGAHVDFHGHLEDGTTRQAPACVYYRVVDRRPVVWMYGPRALDHAATVARLTHLLDPAAGGVPIDSADLDSGVVDVGLEKTDWHRLEVRGYYPAQVTEFRRPRGVDDLALAAWATGALQGSIGRWLGSVGIEVRSHRPVVVHIADLRPRRVAWRGRHTRFGFDARFVTNAVLPAGLGLGQHVSEGFGEVRPWR